jgi:hypothetical protein
MLVSMLNVTESLLYSDPLAIVSLQGYEDLVRLLLTARVDVNDDRGSVK